MRHVHLREDDVAWLVALMEVPSVTPLEGGSPYAVADVQKRFAEGAADRGADRLRWESPPPAIVARPDVPVRVRAAAEADPGFLPAQPSVVAGFGRPQPACRRIVVNFHVDTVGPHIEPRLDGRTLRGRGAVDDKGPGVAATVGVAAAFAAAPALAEEIEVLVTAVPGEEGGAMGVYGTRHVVERGHTGRLMVFAEPTGGRVIDACSSSMTPVLTVRGRDSTDDHPYEGHNATLALGFLASHLTAELGPLAERLGAKLCVAGLHTGASHNRVYGTGELKLNIAYYDQPAGAELATAVERAVATAQAEFARRHGRHPAARMIAEDWSRVVHLAWEKRGLPVLANRDRDMEALLAAAGLPRHDGRTDGTAFTCDAIWAAGPDRYVVVCGPGHLDRNGAHTQDEHIHLDELDRFATRCRDLVLAFGELTTGSGT